MALTTLLLLLPPCTFTHVWHIASEQFNSSNDDSPVWVSYRVSLCPLLCLCLFCQLLSFYLTMHSLVQHQMQHIVAVLAATLLALSTFCTCEMAQLSRLAVQHFAQICMWKARLFCLVVAIMQRLVRIVFSITADPEVSLTHAKSGAIITA